MFLDVDGTLLEIRDNPSDVSADSELTELLEACFDVLDGAMSLVSGRSIAEVDRIFSPSVFPVAGAHGAELRVDGGAVTRVANEALPDNVLCTLEAMAQRDGRLLLEKKRGGASLHYRRAPELEAECRQTIDALLAELGDTYRLIAGKMVFEIAPAAHNKGAAVESFLEQPPFAGRLPVFVGDDVTDEDGFAAANRHGGISIHVGGARDTAARYSLPDVAAVHDWLRVAVLIDNQKATSGAKQT